MTQIIDKRGKPLTVTFGDLKVGDFFQNEADCICMKIDHDKVLNWTTGFVNSGWDSDDLLIPLKATITIERGD